MKLNLKPYQYKQLDKIILPDGGPSGTVLLEWIEQLVRSSNCEIVHKEWRSKYNSYVIYDYEPFGSDGFQIEITIHSTKPVYMEYVQYEVAERMAKINFLEEIFEDSDLPTKRFFDKYKKPAEKRSRTC